MSKKSALEQSMEEDQKELEKLLSPDDDQEEEEQAEEDQSSEEKNAEEEDQQEDSSTDDDQEEDASEDVEDASGEEESKDDDKSTKKDDEPAQKPDNAAMARMRVEANKAKQREAEALARAEAAEQALKKMNSSSSEDVDLDGDTGVEQQKLSPELEEVVFQQKINKATQDFKSLEENWHDKPADYDAIGIAYRGALYNAYKVQNPTATDDQVMQQVKVDLLTKAGNYVKAGVDPCEALYNEAKSLGLQPYYPQEEQEDAQEEEQPKVKKKPSLKTIAKNKKRSAGMAGTKGASNQVNLTGQTAVEMPLSEFAKLTPSELQALEYGEE